MMAVVFLPGCDPKLEDSAFCEAHFRADMPKVSVDQLVLGWPCLKNKTFGVSGVVEFYRDDQFKLYDSHEDYRYGTSTSRVYLRFDKSTEARLRDAIENAPEEGVYITIIAEIDEIAEYIIIRAVEVL